MGSKFEMELSLQEFLKGPGMEDADLDVDRIFAKQLARMVDEILSSDPSALDRDESLGITVSATNPGFSFESVESGVVLRSPDGEIAGAYLSPDVAIDERYQGLGLGAELIAEYFLRRGDLPPWNLDSPQYSPQGVTAHESAYRFLKRNPELVAAKIAIIDGVQDEGRPVMGTGPRM